MSQKEEQRCFSLSNIISTINRKKTLGVDILATELRRCLNTLDICFLGVGHMIGAGIYVLTGEVAKRQAGPSVVISYLIAGITSLLAALCYAEFGARVPKAGSAYVYTYVTMGELWAFVIGWDVILEQMIGAASVARGWSGYVDMLAGNAIINATEANVGKLQGNFFGEAPDFVAFGFCCLVCALLMMGVKGSSIVNSLLTGSNLVVIIVVVSIGAYYADPKNWVDIPGGFFAFGFDGVIAGAAKCFFAFVGFDSIATSGEEARNPSRSIPVATFLAMFIATAAYVAMSIILTLLVPYDQIVVASAFSSAFLSRGTSWPFYVVSVGALMGMTTSMFGSLFALPRCVYAMASDGLLFRFLAYVHPKSQLPIYTFITCSLLTAVIALLFSMDKLVDFMSIGTLMAYTMVSANVIILRYRPVKNISPITEMDIGGSLNPSTRFNFHFLASARPGLVPAWTTIVLTCALIGISLILRFLTADLTAGHWWPILLIVALLSLVGFCFFLLGIHQQSTQKLSFRVPWVPFLPACSIFCNLYLMVNLDYFAWIRFAVWMLIGVLIYTLYGVRNSKNKQKSSEIELNGTKAQQQQITKF